MLLTFTDGLLVVISWYFTACFVFSVVYLVLCLEQMTKQISPCRIIKFSLGTL